MRERWKQYLEGSICVSKKDVPPLKLKQAWELVAPRRNADITDQLSMRVSKYEKEVAIPASFEEKFR